jgi:hypothetical protein
MGEGGKKLEWKDYLAIVIALLETLYLPIIILILVLFFVAVFFSFTS